MFILDLKCSKLTRERSKLGPNGSITTSTQTGLESSSEDILLPISGKKMVLVLQVAQSTFSNPLFSSEFIATFFSSLDINFSNF